MHQYIQRANDALKACAGRLTLEQLTMPLAGKWTIAEILEHLSRTYSHTAAGAQRAVTENRSLSRPGGLRSMFRAFVVVECGYLPSGWRRLMLEAFIPKFPNLWPKPDSS